MLSKLDPGTCAIDLFVPDICKTGKGERLAKCVVDAILPNRVSVNAVGDVSHKSVSSINKYLIIEKYRMWKLQDFQNLISTSET